MKKILAIALTLTLVFALAVSSSAATLATSWTQLLDGNVDGFGLSEGTVEVTDDGAINLIAPAGMHWPQAGVAYADKVAVDGLEFVINANAFSVDSPNGYAALHMCADQFSDYGIGILGGRTWAVVVPDLLKSFSFTIHSTNLKIWIDGAGGSYDLPDTIAANTDVTVKFAVEEGNIVFYVNGTKVQAEGVDVAIPAEGIIDADGKAYLCLSAVGWGGSGTAGVAYKTINGQAANTFNGQAAGGNNDAPAGPADIEVIAIAGAMIVALMAAAFVVKARKA